MDNPYSYLKEHEGEVLTYPQLCSLIGEDKKSGKGKSLHLKSLGQYLDLDSKTVPRKLILREVYSSKGIKITRERGKFFPYIKNMLLHELQSLGTIQKVYSELIKDTGLASEQYLKARFDETAITVSIKDKFKSGVNPDLVAEEAQQSFFSMSWNILKEIMRSSLRQMQDKELIEITQSLRLFRKAYSPKGKEYYEKHDLSLDEHEQYVKIQTEIIKKYALSGPQDLFYKGKDNQKIHSPQSEYQRQLNIFIRSLGYTFSTTLFIISLLPAGEQLSIEERYLDKSALRKNATTKILEEKSFAAAIPAPSLKVLSDRFL